MPDEMYVTVDLSKADSQSGRLELSEVFESEDYNMKLVLYPKGVQPYDHKCLSVFIAFVCGPHDEELTWPFRKAIQVTIRKPCDCDKTYKQTICFHLLKEKNEAGQKPNKDDSRAKGNGLQDFISLESLKGFMDDDKIEIKACVQDCKEHKTIIQ